MKRIIGADGFMMRKNLVKQIYYKNKVNFIFLFLSSIMEAGAWSWKCESATFTILILWIKPRNNKAKHLMCLETSKEIQWV